MGHVLDRVKAQAPAPLRVEYYTHHHHVLSPHCVSGQVDRDPGAFYSEWLSERCRSERHKSAVKCRQDFVPPVLMAP